MSDLGAIVYKGAAAVTQSDATTDPNGPFVAIQATTAAGLAKVTCRDGLVATVYLPLGVPLNLAVTRVWTTVTTATGIIGFYGGSYRP